MLETSWLPDRFGVPFCCILGHDSLRTAGVYGDVCDLLISSTP